MTTITDFNSALTKNMTEQEREYYYYDLWITSSSPSEMDLTMNWINCDRNPRYIIEKDKKYELPDELWNIVKEYAGIYNISTEWNKIEKVGVNKLHTYYKDNFNKRITNINHNASKSRKAILKFMMQYGMNKEKYTNLNKLITTKRQVTKNETDFTKYKVGDEVIYTHCYGAGCYNYYCGVITKVNKASITFKPYQDDNKVSDNPNGFQNQTSERVSIYYDKSKFNKPKTIRTSFTVKRFAKPYELDRFEFWTEVHDWGR